MLKQHEIVDRVEEGAVVARLIIEVLGKPKEHVKETMDLLMNRLKEEQGVTIINSKVAKISQVENSMFSTYADIEVLLDDMQKLNGICFFYMPSSVEILQPAEFSLQCSAITDLYNDLLGKLHNVDMVAKNLRAENDTHKMNMGKLLRSSILALLSTKRTPSEIANLLYIPLDQTENILNHLEKEGLLKKVGKYYQR